MGRSFVVDDGALKEVARVLKGSAFGRRPSAAESDRFGSVVAVGAVSRFEEYWRSGQSAVDEVVVGLADAVGQAADAYGRRDAEDAEGFRGDRGGFHGF